MALSHRNEKTGCSVDIQILRRDVDGSFLEITYNEGSGHPPMLMHIPFEAIIAHLEKGTEQNGAGKTAP